MGGGSHLFLVLTVATMITFSLVVARANASEDSSEDGGVLCISKCDTCPMICSTPPPPPSQIFVIYGSPPPAPSKSYPPPELTPSPKQSPPSPKQPPPSPPPPAMTYSSQPTPTTMDQPRGGVSYPYYYFYTSGAPNSFVNLMLGLLLLLVLSLNLV